jgi:hypothetical protein
MYAATGTAERKIATKKLKKREGRKKEIGRGSN